MKNMSYVQDEPKRTTDENGIVYRSNKKPVKVASVKIPRHMAESSSSIRLREKNKRIIASLKHKDRAFF